MSHFDTCINCFHGSDVDGMTKCAECGYWRHEDCGPCESCRQDSEAEGVAVGEAREGQVRQSADSVGTTPTVHPSRCTCDPLEAEHVCVDSKQYHDSGDVRYEWRCVTCKAEWSETRSHWNLYRDDTEEAALALSRELSPECSDEEAFI